MRDKEIEAAQSRREGGDAVGRLASAWRRSMARPCMPAAADGRTGSRFRSSSGNIDLSCDQNSGRGLACTGRARPVRWWSSACSPRSLPLLQFASGRPAPKYAAVWNAAVLGAISAHHLLFILDSEGYLRTNRTSSPHGRVRWSTPSAGRSYMAPRRPIQRLMLSWPLHFTA